MGAATEGEDNMGRIYSNYEVHEFESVKKKAEELGFSASSFQKYCVMLYLGDRTNAVSIADLQEEMLNALEDMENGKTFIVSTLLPDKWTSLSRSTKMQLAKYLASYVYKHSERFIVADKVRGTINKYKKVM